MNTKLLVICYGAALTLLANSEITSAATVICGPDGCPQVLSATYPGSPASLVEFLQPNTLGRVDIIELGTEGTSEVGCILPSQGNVCLSHLGGPVVEGDVVLVETGRFSTPSDFLNNPSAWSDVIRFRNQRFPDIGGPVGTVELISDLGTEPENPEFNAVPLSPSDLSDNVVFLEELSDPTIYTASFFLLRLEGESGIVGTQYFIHSDVEVLHVEEVSEPPAIGVFGIGLLGLIAYGWRTRKRAQPAVHAF